MKIGKFKMSLIYDCECDICGEYRSNIGWTTPSIMSKPTAQDLRREGWTYKEGVGQICPNCNKSNERLKENVLRENDEKLKKIILAKCDEREREGYDHLTDSDIMDIIEECERRGIEVTREKLKEFGID